MARRDIEKQLCTELKASSFNFIPRGEIRIEELYELIEQRFPDLCDNNYLCSEHCKSNSKQPEWKHAVRSVLSQLKSKNENIRYTGNIGWWSFI